MIWPFKGRAGGKTVATIIAGYETRLSSDLLKQLMAVLPESRSVWLVEGSAVDIFCDDTVEAVRATLQAKLLDEPFDVIVQPAANRQKKLLVADMESTIIEQEMLDELADMIGVGPKVAAITRRAMNGELDFTAALRERAALLEGKPSSLLEEAARRITIMPGAAALVTKMKGHGAQCWLVSGGFNCFVKPVAEQLGFDRFYANELVIRDGTITGEVAKPILDKNSKQTFLEQACRELNISLAESAAVGDGANDIPMLSACNAGGGLGVAFQAKPKVREVVPHQINYGDLTALLYAQDL